MRSHILINNAYFLQHAQPHESSLNPMNHKNYMFISKFANSILVRPLSILPYFNKAQPTPAHSVYIMPAAKTGKRKVIKTRASFLESTHKKKLKKHTILGINTHARKQY